MSLEKIFESTKHIFEQGLTSFLITSAIIIALTIFVNRLIDRVSKKMIARGKVDQTAIRFMTKILNGTIYVLAFFGITMQIIPFQKFAVSLLASSSIAVVILGFAAQEAFSNIVAGMFISIFKPFSVGDIITLREQNITGTIIDINLRHTVINTFENNAIIVSNSIMNTSIIENKDFYDSVVNNFLFISISYTSNIQLAKQIMMEEIQKHSLTLIDDNHKTNIVCTNLGDYGVELRANVYSKNASEGFILLSDLRQNIKNHFDLQDIEIPYPYQNVIIKK